MRRHETPRRLPSMGINGGLSAYVGLLLLLLLWGAGPLDAGTQSTADVPVKSLDISPPKERTKDPVSKANTSLAEINPLDASTEVQKDSELTRSPATVSETSKSDKKPNRTVPGPTKSVGFFDPTVVKYVIVPHPKNEKDLKAVIQNATNEAVDEYLGGNGGVVGGGTQIYIIAIIGVLPAAGAAIWCLKWTIHKRRKAQKGESSREGSEPSTTGPAACTGLVKSYVKAPDSGTNYTKAIMSQPKEYNEEKYYKPSWQQQYQYHQQLSPKISTGSSQSAVSPFGKWEFPRSRLQLLEILGEGNFGQVWRSEAHQLNGIPGVAVVAVKTVKANSSHKEKQDILKEVQIMQCLGRHPNVVTLLGCCTRQEPFYVIMEYVVRGKLLSYLRSHRSSRSYYNCHPTSHSLTSRDLTLFAYQVAQGMEYITSRGIIHRDLAARNVLVDHNQVCKVADFGLARCLREKHCEVYEQKSKGALPIRWMAPESLYLNVFTAKSDVWAFGVLLWEIVTLGSTPYPGMGPREVIHYVREGHVMERPHHCRSELYRVMRNSWSADPKDRPSFSSLKKDLGRLLELQTGYIDLEHFPENCYYNLYQSPGERV